MKRILAGALGILGALALAYAQAQATDTPSTAAAVKAGYTPNWQHVARQILHRTLKLAPGDRVILHYLPGHTPGLVDALRSEIITSGAIISAELTWPTAEMGKYYDTLSADQKTKLAAEQDSVYREIFARSDIYLWLDSSPVDDLVPREFEHLVADSKVRSIHCHWFDSDDTSEHDVLWKMYEEAVDVDPAQLESVLSPMADSLRGSTVHLTSPGGTDLTFRIANDAWFHKNTGDAGPDKARNPASTRDREEEIPSSVLRTTGVVGTTGKLVATVFSSLKKDTVVLTFRDGRIVKVEPKGGNGDEFAKWFDKTSGDRDRVSELVIGTNPKMAAVLPSGFMPDLGYGAGVVRLDVGENWESGGTLRTSDHQQWWLMVTDGTLKAGRTVLVKDGKLVAQR
jgi:hypothetical protein